MSDRDKMLSEFRQGLEGIDPVLDRAADYGRGMRAVQGVVRSQGQVMSESLKNNAMLWEDRKALKARNAELLSGNESLRRINEQLVQRNAELEKTVAESGGDRYLALYQQARRTLEANLHDLLEADQIAAKLSEMKAQHEQLRAEGVPEPTTPDGGAIEEHATAAGLDIL